jgi:hypothetical protein
MRRLAPSLSFIVYSIWRNDLLEVYMFIYCDLQLSLETGSFTAQFDRWNAQVTKGKFKCCQAEMRMLSWEI